MENENQRMSPDEVLTQAGIVCAQFAHLYTHSRTLPQEILDAYMIGLNIQMMQAGEHETF